MHVQRHPLSYIVLSLQNQTPVLSLITLSENRLLKIPPAVNKW